MSRYIAKIISGGQTGVDQGALRAAVKCELPTGGWAPKGWLTEDGPQARLLKAYGLKEHISERYSARTRQNVIDSDFTIIINPEGYPPGRGTKLTMALTEEVRKGCIIIYNFNKHQPRNIIHSIKIFWIAAHRPLIINVAGPRESRVPGVQMATYLLFKKVFLEVQRIEKGGAK